MIKKIIWGIWIIILVIIWMFFDKNIKRTTNQIDYKIQHQAQHETYHKIKPEHDIPCIEMTKNKMNEFMSTEWSTFQEVTFKREEETLSWYNEFWVVSYEKDWISEKSAVLCKVNKDEEVVFIQISPREFEDTRLFHKNWRKNLCDEYVLDTLNIRKAIIDRDDELEWWNDFNRKGKIYYFSWDQKISNNANCFIDMVYGWTVIHITDNLRKTVANKHFSQKTALQEHCTINWWKIETKWEEQYCILPDNSSCEIQDYYNSKCHTWTDN